MFQHHNTKKKKSLSSCKYDQNYLASTTAAYLGKRLLPFGISSVPSESPTIDSKDFMRHMTIVKGPRAIIQDAVTSIWHKEQVAWMEIEKVIKCSC